MKEFSSEWLQKEISRFRAIGDFYKKLGPAGNFVSSAIELDLQEASQALISKDAKQMMRAYKSLMDYQS